VFEVACSIPHRMQELNRITSLAHNLVDKDEDSYNTLCRACCVLLASHLEGFLKDLSKSLASDLYFNLQTFAKMPEAMKRSFCEKIAFYEGVPKEDVNQRVKQLIAFFSTHSVAIDFQAFSYKENNNKNPGPDVLETSFEKMGVPAVLHSIAGGRLENIFKNDANLSYILRRDIRRFRSTLYSFPYKPLPNTYAFNFKAAKTAKGKGGNSLWHAFIEEVMRRRHSIVHGDTMANDTDVIELDHDIEKMDVLMHSVLYSAAAYLVIST